MASIPGSRIATYSLIALTLGAIGFFGLRSYFRWQKGAIESDLMAEAQNWKQRDQAIRDLSERQATLAKEIRDFAGSGKCSSSTDCRAVGLGAKICGGYRNFFHYSVQTVDEDRFFSSLQEFNRIQQSITNQSYEIPGCGVPTAESYCIAKVCGPKGNDETTPVPPKKSN